MTKAFGLQQPISLPDDEPLWPISDLQQPEVVHSAEAFIESMLFQPHLDRIVVLRNGIELLDQHVGVPEAVENAVRGALTMRSFLENLGPDLQRRFRGRLWHYGTKGKEKEIKRNDGSKKKRAFSETVKELMRRQEDGDIPVDAPLYISELRWHEKVRHPSAPDELVKTATRRDVYDSTPLARRMPLWERSEGGIFVGERGAGSGMHVDQCLWSNVGRNWCGFKLFALWGWEERHSILDEAGKGTLFHMPLSEREKGFLRRAKKIALIRPGDIWVFSGGQPHTALIVGDGISISAYESFVSAHPAAVGLLVRSNTKDSHWKPCWMDDDDLDELYEDVVDSLQRSLRAPDLERKLRLRLQSCVQAMRTDGDPYCRELWEQEDSGKRRRRREEDSQDEEASGGALGKSSKSSKSSSEKGEERSPYAKKTRGPS
mmetsp:Transcript_7256/g.13416  ORF Transcript_7256/g.13416 Transcript_7256/m.13416 type:complete len:431 (-) Transcript_7256:44-1336(-)|eukprot:CAMPEP_0172738826 /NCGR_PEP_ID=MMETSP1074-20121228/121086_1 /TAXON_ID=2916 /ORGANISM="Ceratium fusus, Strain PA161109" /LENGTH=430 /DNA_ID=CAMNT_0013568541 /DNA_START=19 /DNA_END=1311 /DNA_ORIENTATION=+